MGAGRFPSGWLPITRCFASGWLPWLLLACAACLLHDAGAFAESVPATPVPFKDEHPVQQTRQEFSNFLDEGRGKKKKDMMRMIMAIKMVLVSILVPKVIGLALFASWKGITISLIAFTIAAIAIKWSSSSQESKKSIQLLIKKQDHNGENHHHEHWWRKIREAEPVYYEEEPHHHEPYHGWMDD